MSIIVFGSINMDLVVQTPRLPAPGETLAGHSFFTAPGGKGANQAVACARLGAETHMLGRVGNDVFSGALRESLSTAGVNIAGVASCEGPSGIAAIAVNDAGENTIVIIAGANASLGQEDLTRLEALLPRAQVLLLQLEVPLESVIAAAQAAQRQGVTVILDPAPARILPNVLLQASTIITPNETEAALLVGFPLITEQDVERAALELLRRGVKHVVIKRGAQGAYWHNGIVGMLLPSFPVKAVDTVAAGDAFNGGLATALQAGRRFEEALRWGLAAGALAVTKPGAQQAMPSRAELQALLATFPQATS